MIKPIGIVKRIEYFLKNPNVKDFCLHEVNLSNKKVNTYPQRHVLYHIDRDYNFIVRSKAKGFDNTRMDSWSFKIIDNKIRLIDQSTAIVNKSGSVYHSGANDTLILKHTESGFNSQTKLGNIINSNSFLASKIKYYCKDIKKNSK